MRPWQTNKDIPLRERTTGGGRKVKTLSGSLHNYITERNELQVKNRRRVLVYGEKFQLPTYGTRRVLDEAIEDIQIRKKLKHVIALLEQLLAEEPQEDSRPDRHGSAYRNRTPLQSRRSRVPADHRLSIPVENDEIPESCRRRIHDALQEFEAGRRCRESEAAYAARNPHKRG